MVIIMAGMRLYSTHLMYAHGLDCMDHLENSIMQTTTEVLTSVLVSVVTFDL